MRGATAFQSCIPPGHRVAFNYTPLGYTLFCVTLQQGTGRTFAVGEIDLTQKAFCQLSGFLDAYLTREGSTQTRRRSCDPALVYTRRE